MKCNVLLFAQLAETVGQSELALDLPDGATAGQATDELCRMHPEIASVRDRIALAVNEAYASTETALTDGCTLALIPPVSGG